MKVLKLENVEIEIIHIQRKEIPDKSNIGKSIVYFELTVLAPKLFEGVETITSGNSDEKVGKTKRDLMITSKGDTLKLKILKVEKLETKI